MLCSCQAKLPPCTRRVSAAVLIAVKMFPEQYWMLFIAPLLFNSVIQYHLEDSAPVLCVYNLYKQNKHFYNRHSFWFLVYYTTRLHSTPIIGGTHFFLLLFCRHTANYIRNAHRCYVVIGKPRSAWLEGTLAMDLKLRGLRTHMQTDRRETEQNTRP